MKPRIFSLRSAALAFVLAIGAPLALADDDADMLRAKSEDAFMQLTLNSNQALKSALKNSPTARGSDKSFDADDDAKFKIVGVDDPAADENDDAQDKMETAAQIWFELFDGAKVDPRKHRWNAKEKFYVYVKAAAPVYVYLFHNAPSENGDAEDSVLVYPTKRYPESFKPIQAGRATRLPVKFEMDDDSEDENMSIFVVRADWEGVQDYLTSQAVDSVAVENGRPVVNAEISENVGADGTLKCLNVRVASQKEFDAKSVRKIVRGASAKEAKKIANNVNALDSAKFRVCEPLVEESDEAEDVCFYLFSAQKVGHWRLTIKK